MAQILFNGQPTAQIDFNYTPDSDEPVMLTLSGSAYAIVENRVIGYNLFIDGKLVAIGVNDITRSTLNAQYFIYDPDYSFLCLDILGAIHEIEFMKMYQKKYNHDFLWY